MLRSIASASSLVRARKSMTAQALPATTFSFVPPPMMSTLSVIPLFGIVEADHPHDLLRQLVDGVDALFGCDAGVRFLAAHLDADFADALAARFHHAAGQRRFGHDDGGCIGGLAFDRLAAGAAADLLVGRGQHDHASVELDMELGERLEREKRQAQPGFHVEHTGSVEPVAIAPQRGLLPFLRRPDGIHVAENQDRLVAAAAFGPDARAFVAGYQREAVAPGTQHLGVGVGETVDAFPVARGRIDRRKPLERFEKAILVRFEVAPDSLQSLLHPFTKIQSPPIYSKIPASAAINWRGTRLVFDPHGHGLLAELDEHNLAHPPRLVPLEPELRTRSQNEELGLRFRLNSHRRLFSGPQHQIALTN